MRTTFPKHFAPFIQTACVAAVCVILAGKPAPAVAAPDGDSPAQGTASPSPVAIPEGNLLIRQSAESVRAYRSIQAKLRQRVELFGRHLAGSGTYLQAGRRDQPLWRLEIKLQAGESPTIHQQVCDGEVLWLRQASADQTRLARVDLNQLRRLAAARLKGPLEGPLDMSRLGGLPRMVDALAEEFDFTQVRAANLAEEPIWLLRGHRRSSPRQDRGNWTADSPHYAQVMLSRSEDLPLFPYRIEYFREPAKQGAGQPRTPELLLVTEFFEVRVNEPLHPRLFLFQPDTPDVIDETDKYLRWLEG